MKRKADQTRKPEEKVRPQANRAVPCSIQMTVSLPGHPDETFGTTTFPVDMRAEPNLTVRW